MKTIFNIPLFNKTGTDNTKNNYIICGEATHKVYANRLEFKPFSAETFLPFILKLWQWELA